MLPSPGSLLALVLVLALLAGMGSRLGSFHSEAVAKSPINMQSENDAQGPALEQSGTVAQFFVHVAGAVVSPGVVVLAPGSRVVDAIDKAGGPAHDADLDALNLARTVVDGEQIRVLRLGEISSTGTSDTSSGSADPIGGGASTRTDGRGCVNLNTADALALESLDGIGPALAKRIVSYREKSGSFESVDDLDAVPGIGSALVERIRLGVCQ